MGALAVPRASSALCLTSACPAAFAALSRPLRPGATVRKGSVLGFPPPLTVPVPSLAFQMQPRSTSLQSPFLVAPTAPL